MNEDAFDFALVGAGMAGASLAAELAPYARVLVLEAEDQPGYHATGRSAAFWEECYGGPDIVPLTRASGGFLRAQGLLRDRGALYVGRAQDAAAMDSFMAEFVPKGVRLERLGREKLEQIVPGIRRDWCDAIWQPDCADIDVGALHALYLAAARKAGAKLETRARLAAADYSADSWHLRTHDGRVFRAMQLVNAAGAWADDVAVLAGVEPIGITPLRRTVAQLKISPPPPVDLPLVLDIGGRFYFKPESARLWLSPHDEEPSLPCDAAPEELAVAEAIDRFEKVVDWAVEKVETKWAGLRSFAPDRLPVYGADPDLPAFIWCAGQGGFGIQTAPAGAALLAAQLLGRPASLDLSGVDPAKYAPARFR